MDDNTSNTTSTETPTVTPTPTTTPFKFSVSTLQKTLTSGTPQASQKYLNAGPTVTPIVSPTVSPTPFQSHTNAENGNLLKKWYEIDKIQLTVDVIGIAADIGSAITIESPIIAIVVQVVGVTVEAADIGYSVYKFSTSIDKNANSAQEKTLSQIIELGMTLNQKTEKLIPFIGSIASLYSIYENVINR